VTIRILIVDDSDFFREVLRDVLGGYPDLEVVGEAADGAAAIEQVARLRPDVVTMDVLLPLVGGIEAIRTIMERHPTAIVGVSRLVGRGERLGLDALAAGAIDVFEKPTTGLDAITARRLVELLRSAARGHGTLAPKRPPARGWPRFRVPPLCVGLVASTGGPQVLRGLLAALPAAFPIPIVVVQHTVAGFAAPLASWLDDASPLAVATAVSGRRVAAGQVAIAPDGAHLELDRDGVFVLRGGPLEAGHRPSGTVLLRSLARGLGARALGAVLTGMGRDGSDGLAEIDRAGGIAVVQDPDDATIDTMPRHAMAMVARAAIATAAELPALLLAAARGGAA
jgi:two-component system, chemotaxis family, protein-glutamate methylesterase/glutaminase